MHLKRLITLGWFASALPLASVSAQSPSSTQSTAPDQAHWSFSLGADPGNLDFHTPGPGIDARVVANLTRSWQSKNSKWERHISLMVGADAPHAFRPLYSSSFGPECDCWVRYASRYAGLTVGAAYDLLRASRFTPYLTGGTGLYYTGLRRSAADGPTPDTFPYYKTASSQDYFALGANAGLGLKIRLGSHTLFIEQMLHELSFKQQGLAVAPLNIGIRF